MQKKHKPEQTRTNPNKPEQTRTITHQSPTVPTVRVELELSCNFNFVVVEVAFIVVDVVAAVVHVVVAAVLVLEIANVEFHLQFVVHLDLVDGVHEGHDLLLGDRQVGVEAGVGTDAELPLSVAMVVDFAGLDGVVQLRQVDDAANHGIALFATAVDVIAGRKRHPEALAAFLRDDALVVDHKHHVANPQRPRAVVHGSVAVIAVGGEADGENGLAVFEK